MEWYLINNTSYRCVSVHLQVQNNGKTARSKKRKKSKQNILFNILLILSVKFCLYKYSVMFKISRHTDIEQRTNITFCYNLLNPTQKRIEYWFKYTEQTWWGKHTYITGLNGFSSQIKPYMTNYVQVDLQKVWRQTISSGCERCC